MKLLNLKIFGLQCDLRWKVTYSGIKNTTQRNRKTETFPSSLITPSLSQVHIFYRATPCFTFLFNPYSTPQERIFLHGCLLPLIGLRMESSQE